MVIHCKDQFNNKDEKYQNYFEQFPYPLSDFQKWAIYAIVNGHHCLITAHTGSGKTLPAEFAIQFFKEQNKKSRKHKKSNKHRKTRKSKTRSSTRHRKR